jgi:hypothetical protein
MANDSKHRSKAATQAATAPAKAAEPAATQPTPNPARVDKMLGAAPPSPRFARPEVLDLGDAVVGDRVKDGIVIHALDVVGQGPRIQATVSGDPAFELSQAPLFLPGRDTYDPSYAFKLDFHPTREGTFEGALTIHVHDATNEVIHIPLRAGAHLPGGKTRAEVSAETAAAQRDASAAAVAAEQEARVQRMIEAEWDRDEPYHTGKKEKLDSVAREVGIATQNLNKAQRDGVDVAKAEIGKFVRRKPAPEQPSLLEKLAWTALDLATASIAGAVAAKLKPAVVSVFSKRVQAQGPMRLRLNGRTVAPTAEMQPSDAMVTLVTDGLKAVVKDGGKAAKGQLQAAPKDEPKTSREQAYENASSDPMGAFLEFHLASLRQTEVARETLTTVTARNALLPLLRTAPDAAIETLEALRDSLKTEDETIANTQTTHSVAEWVRYVFETSSTPSDVNRSFTSEYPLTKIDGLVDVKFRADQRGETPVVPYAVRVSGVRKAVVHRIGAKKLSELGLTVRASSDLRSPSTSVTLVRHDSGSITFTDPSNWLERRAKWQGFGGDAPRAAKALVEQEIMAKSLVDIAGNVENDSED